MSSQRAVPVSPVWWHSLRAWSGQKGNVFGVLFSGSDLHTLVQGRSSQQSNVVCLDCKGKQRCCMCNGGQGCSSTWVHPLCPQLHREGCVGNLIPSPRFAKAAGVLCWNLNVKHLLLQHSGKGTVISTCEVQEDTGRSKRPRITHWSLCGYRWMSGGSCIEFLVHFKFKRKE